MQDESSWGNYYNKYLFLARLSSLWRSRYTYNLIKDLKIRSILELGAGTGYCSSYFANKFKVKPTLLDKDKLIVDKLKTRFPGFEIIHSDLFDFKTKRHWELVFSLGVIEHFQKKQRIEAIKIHKRFSSKYVLIAVPLKSFVRNYLLRSHTADYVGYEKLYNQDELIEECNKADLKYWKITTNPLGITILAKTDI